MPFTGRDAELAGLEDWCQEDQGGLICLVTGAGGSGKTQLAIELEHRLRCPDWTGA